MCSVVCVSVIYQKRCWCRHYGSPCRVADDVKRRRPWHMRTLSYQYHRLWEIALLLKPLRRACTYVLPSQHLLWTMRWYSVAVSVGWSRWGRSWNGKQNRKVPACKMAILLVETKKTWQLERRPVYSKTRAVSLYETRVSYSTCWNCDPCCY